MLPNVTQSDVTVKHVLTLCPELQLFHYWKMTQELKLVLCFETTYIRDIVVAAQFKILQCMLMDVIEISDLTA